MGLLDQGIRSLVSAGISELILFVLIFVMLFALMRSINLLGVSKGDDKGKWKESMQKTKPIHTIIALVFAALSILPHHYSRFARYDIVPIVEKSLPQFSFLVLGIFCALILLGFFGLKLGPGSKGNPLQMFVFIISIGFIVFIFGSNMQMWSNPWRRFLTPDLVAVIIAVLVFAMIISFIMGEKKNDKYKSFDDFVGGKGDSDRWKKATAAHKMFDFLKGDK